MISKIVLNLIYTDTIIFFKLFCHTQLILILNQGESPKMYITLIRYTENAITF